MSEETLKALNDRVTELMEKLASANSESKERKLRIKELEAEHETLKETFQKTQKDLDYHKANPSDLFKELEALKGEKRLNVHKEKFAELAKALKIRPDAVDDVFALSGYKADSDDIDEHAMYEAIQATVSKRGYLVAPDAPQPAAPTAPQPQPLPLLPGMGVQQGTTKGNAFVVTRADMGDPRWLAANQQRLAQAYSDGTLRVD